MPTRRNISLNAIRVFATVAQNQSIAQAALVLGVTPSAVSHQVKNLETDLATPLFLRSSNAIRLTPAGQRLLQDVLPGLNILQHATDALIGDENEITIRVSSTFAVRWLIPALERFKERHRYARVRIETNRVEEVQLGPSVDLAITYRRAGDVSGDGEKILTDFSRPVLTPAVLRAVNYRSRQDTLKIPAISCTGNDWDWQCWAAHHGLPFSGMTFADRFDIDDAALHAAAAGLGMVLSPAFMTKTEIDAGTLITLPDVDPVEMGAYYLLQGPRRGGVVRKFRTWLMAELASLT